VLQSILTIVVFAAGLAIAIGCCYLLLLAALSPFHRPRGASGDPDTRLVVIVPAHNEAECITACVTSLLAQDYPRELYRVVVVADNCTDDTVGAASSAGADVLVRDVPELRGKGQALRWAIDRTLAGPAPPDAVVVIDADSVADPLFLRELASVYAAGHPVAQADDVIRPEPGRRPTHLEAAALLLRNHVRFAGRAVLRIPASLCGNGMLLSRAVLESHPWPAYSGTEDGEYALSLLYAGLPTTFALRARVSAAPTPSRHGAYTQSLRWDGGRFALMQEWTLRLLALGARRRDMAMVMIAFDMAVPPLALLAVGAVLGCLAALILNATGIVPAVALTPWLAALVALPAYVLLGLASCRVPGSTYAAFLLAPWFIVRKLRVYARLLRGYDTGSWVRTQRAAEVQDASRPG
jgi:1,2-diacylglycerol 3-beta-glucosyltransferase